MGEREQKAENVQYGLIAAFYEGEIGRVIFQLMYRMLRGKCAHIKPATSLVEKYLSYDITLALAET